MTSREEWLAAVGEDQRRDRSYPLLGSELDPRDLQAEPTAWVLRVVLAQAYDGDRRRALDDSMAEVIEESVVGPGVALESFLDVSVNEAEARVCVDLEILRNVAEIARLKAAHPEVEAWVLVSAEDGGDDPETLVSETIRQLTGVLSGCDAIEIRQADQESFESLWSRLSVGHLLATEAELGSLPNPVQGAGFFSEILNESSS